MFKENPISELMDRVKKLEELTNKLDRESYVYADKYPEASPWVVQYGRHERVPLSDAVSAVLRHCGIVLTYEIPTAGKIVVQKAKK